MQTKKRPVFLDIQVLARHLPLSGIVSILHRISGVLIFIFLPVFLALLGGSLSSHETFETYKAWADNAFFKLILIGFLWLFLHHLLAGVRFLLLDAHIGLEKAQAGKTARWVLIAGAVSAFVLGVALW